MKKYFENCLGALMGAALLQPQQASASTLAYELIADISANAGDNIRDLQRTRQQGAGAPVVENTDATIVAQNNVSAGFGILNADDVTYTHSLTWLSPPALSILEPDSDDHRLRQRKRGGRSDCRRRESGHSPLQPGTTFTATFTNGSLLANIVDGALNIAINDNTPHPASSISASSARSWRRPTKQRPPCRSRPA
jgi:hypothetical protein